MIRRPPPALVAILLVAALVEATAMAWTLMWSSGRFFGGDQEAYRQAALRLIATGSPYHPQLFLGPIANEMRNIPIAYLYPPPLAQLFIPIAAIPADAVAAAAALIQGVMLLALLPFVWRRFAGRTTFASVLGVWLLAVLSYPLNNALYGGNMSGWITIAVATAVVASPRAGAVAGTLLAVAKMTPAILLVPAAFTRGSRLPAVATALVVVGLSVALAPVAWVEWVRALPNILRFPPWDSTHNVAPLVVFGAAGMASIGAVAGIVVAGGSLVASAVLARGGRWFGSVAAAATALLFGTSSLGDHYLAILTPLVLAAWPNSRLSVRVALAAFMAATIVPWWVPDPSLPLRAGYLAATIAACAAVTFQLARYRSRDEVRSRLDAAPAFDLRPQQLNLA